MLASAKQRLRDVRALLVLSLLCSERLRMQPDDGFEWYQCAPHILLLFIKWTLASWRPGDDRPEPTREDMDYILQTTSDAARHLNRVEGVEHLIASQLHDMAPLLGML